MAKCTKHPARPSAAIRIISRRDAEAQRNTEERYRREEVRRALLSSYLLAFLPSHLRVPASLRET
jgi:hypothetical protein